MRSKRSKNDDKVIAAGRITLDDAIKQLKTLVTPAQLKRSRVLYEQFQDQVTRELEGGEDGLAMCMGVTALAKNIIAASPLPELSVFSRSGDPKLDIAMETRLGEALLKLRKQASTKDIRRSDADHDRLMKVVFGGEDGGEAPLSMSIAVMMLAVEVIGSSLRFLN